MNRRLSATLAAAAWLMACAGQPSESRGTSTDHPRKNVTIHVTDGTVNPATAQVLTGGSVLWLNCASEFTVAIVLSSETAAKLGCDDLRPDFGRVATGWRSLPMAPGEDKVIRLACALTPGEYDYEVDLGRGEFDIDDPQLRLEGKIVVK